MVESAPPMRADDDDIYFLFLRVADDFRERFAEKNIFGCFYFIGDERPPPLRDLLARHLFLRCLYISHIDRSERLRRIYNGLYDMDNVQLRFEFMCELGGILHGKFGSIRKIHRRQYAFDLYHYA